MASVDLWIQTSVDSVVPPVTEPLTIAFSFARSKSAMTMRCLGSTLTWFRLHIDSTRMGLLSGFLFEKKWLKDMLEIITLRSQITETGLVYFSYSRRAWLSSHSIDKKLA